MRKLKTLSVFTWQTKSLNHGSSTHWFPHCLHAWLIWLPTRISNSLFISPLQIIPRHWYQPRWMRLTRPWRNQVLSAARTSLDSYLEGQTGRHPLHPRSLTSLWDYSQPISRPWQLSKCCPSQLRMTGVLRRHRPNKNQETTLYLWMNYSEIYYRSP